jgi:hypothetical protein
MTVAPSTRRRVTAEEEFGSSPEVPYIELIDGELVVNEPSVRQIRSAGTDS